MKRVELTVGDKTIGGTLVDFETVREEYNSLQTFGRLDDQNESGSDKYHTNRRVYPQRRTHLCSQFAERTCR